LTTQPATLERALTDEDYSTVVRKLERHELDWNGNQRQDEGSFHS
jgi:hypothetical protein